MAKNIDLRQTMDARVWAAEFMLITGGTADEETMITWFANSIMCGYDHHYWQSDEYKQMTNSTTQDLRTTTERELIQRLADALINAVRVVYDMDGTQHISTAEPVLAAADAYLAQPEPEGPTDEELDELSHEYGWLDANHSKPWIPFARSVLDRWGTR